MTQTREMFAVANREFKDVLDELGVNGYADVRWSEEMIAELAAAFDASHGKHRHHRAHGH